VNDLGQIVGRYKRTATDVNMALLWTKTAPSPISAR
jgi:hypothetical protein